MGDALPFEPESLPAMRERFEQALRGDYLHVDGEIRPHSPDTQRKHVFDFSHGLRLVVSFACSNRRPQALLHVGVIFQTQRAFLLAVQELRAAGRMPVLEEGEIQKNRRRVTDYWKLDSAELVSWMRGHFRALCRRPCDLVFGGAEDYQVWHLFGPTRAEFEALAPPVVGGI